MRIIAGKNKGRRLNAPTDDFIRPTSDRVRESIFNILRFPKWSEEEVLHGAKVLDVFCGTGALGLEALSEGAENAIFMDNSSEALKVCQSNITALHEEGSVQTILSDATNPGVARGVMPRTLVFCDPPYGAALGVKALGALAKGEWLAEGAICVLEDEKKHETPVWPQGFTLLDERAYGKTAVYFLKWG